MNCRSLVVGAVAALCCAGFSGCTNGHELPTISGAPTGSDLEAIATSYYNCMSDAGIEMQRIQNDTGQLAVVNFTGDHEYIWTSTEGGLGYLPPAAGIPADMAEAMQEFDAVSGSGPTLWVDRVDRTSSYVQCLNSSGYSEAAAWGISTQADPAQYQRQVDANNQWTACARENGWPDIKDSVMPTDMEHASNPFVVLPATMTEDQLRALLDACPNFDADKQDMLNDWWATHAPAGGSTGGPEDYPDGYLPDPNLTFSENPTSVVIPAEPPTADTEEDHLTRLNMILYEKQIAYNNQTHG